MDFSSYKDTQSLLEDIKSIKIQGATNVALATIYGVQFLLKKFGPNDTSRNVYEHIIEVGTKLANARPNEPLAKNFIKFLKFNVVTKNLLELETSAFIKTLDKLCDEYFEIIEDSKKGIIDYGLKHLKETEAIFTHCHSSTAENLIIGLNKSIKGLKVVCTETRPLFQGRITATNLVSNGVDTTLVTDSAAESYITGKGLFDIDIVFIGADEIDIHGNAMNKVGSWGVVLAAYFANKPVYVITPFLKVDTDTVTKPFIVERRDPSEVWDKPPKGLKIDNPSFDIVPGNLITGYITEFGLIYSADVVRTIREKYGWLF
ncbi:MAG TPA: translation initiation factor eIF-2B subunit [Candidatus Dojkabacteria bacterium]|nr:translation initiation factor eIF-2B subunit [Candidatus Dojkabacteria bacterium]